MCSTGTCRGSAIEVAPDGLQAAFTRNGLWRAGGGGGLERDSDDMRGATEELETPAALFQDRRRPMIRFDYDYAGEIYNYRMVARGQRPPSARGHDVGVGSVVLPAGTRHAGPQMTFTGRWAHRSADDDHATQVPACLYPGPTMDHRTHRRTDTHTSNRIRPSYRACGGRAV